MKRTIICFMVAFIVLAIRTDAREDPFENRVRIRTTCYVSDPDNSVTCTGDRPRYGIIAGMKEWEGCVAEMWSEDGEFIGYFEVLDTGGEPIRKGYVIDVWQPTLDDAWDWVGTWGDYTYIHLVKGEG